MSWLQIVIGVYVFYFASLFPLQTQFMLDQLSDLQRKV